MIFGKVEELISISCHGMTSVVHDTDPCRYVAEQRVFARAEWHVQSHRRAAYDPEIYLPIVKATPEPRGGCLPDLFPVEECVPCEFSVVQNMLDSRTLIPFPWNRDFYFMCAAGYRPPPF